MLVLLCQRRKLLLQLLLRIQRQLPNDENTPVNIDNFLAEIQRLSDPAWTAVCWSELLNDLLTAFQLLVDNTRRSEAVLQAHAANAPSARLAQALLLAARQHTERMTCLVGPGSKLSQHLGHLSFVEGLACDATAEVVVLRIALTHGDTRAELTALHQANEAAAKAVQQLHEHYLTLFTLILDMVQKLH